MGSAVTGFVNALFPGMAGYDMPDSPEVSPLPTREEEVEPVAKSLRDAEQRKLKARRGMSGTLLTSPLGVSGGSGGAAASGLLGRTLT